MIRKLTLVIGFGAGYLLGAKAGTDRYDQIVSRARSLAGLPLVQQAADGLQETASTLADRAKDTLNDKIDSMNARVAPDATVDLTYPSPQTTG